eukprot:GHVR01144790.1.p1 GENE.GHVR01144790.1~~GHVR01144790.1.p1  ORF type:complete len:252 (+),score=46.93 GHVR01144790.1:561-1316(+)
MGCDAATSDLIVVLDSHMRPPWEWLDRIVDGFEKWPGSVMCPRSAGFEIGSGFNGAGARFIADEHGYWNSTWNERVPADAPNGTVIGCVMGGCYVVGRELLTKLGGYAPHHVGWGYEEEPLSIRAWISGHDCRLLNFPVAHQYKRDVQRKDATGREPAPWVVWFNRHLEMASLFDDGLYENVHAPIMWAHYRPEDLAIAVAAAAPSVAAMRAHVASIRKVSDEDVGFRVGIPHAKTQQQYRWFWEAHGKRN